MPIRTMKTLCKTSANSMQRIMSGYSEQASSVQAHCVLRVSSIQEMVYKLITTFAIQMSTHLLSFTRTYTCLVWQIKFKYNNKIGAQNIQAATIGYEQIICEIERNM